MADTTIDSNNLDGDPEVSVEVQNLWKVFGPDPQQVMDDPVLRMADKKEVLRKTGGVVALRDVSFSVNKGEFFVLMGLSGSGKSTLIRCVIRLAEPTSGSVLIHGEDICKYDEVQLANMRRHTTGMVFQHFGLLPHRSVIENVAYGLKVRGVEKEERYEKARVYIDKVGLKGWEDRLPSALSGGMQQRVGIARALTGDPSILLLDEPFSGLDPLIRRQMQDELIELQDELQKTLLFVTHDLHEALKVGDRIAIMRDGEIIQIGTGEDVITNPSDAYVRQFVQDASPAKVLTARTVMEQPSVLLYSWQGPKAALQILRDANVDSAFVVTRNARFLGLVTVDRVVSLIRKRGTYLRDALEPDLQTCGPDTVIEDLVPLVASTRYPVAVVDEDGRFVGEVYVSTIIANMIQEQVPEDAQTETVEADEVAPDEDDSSEHSEDSPSDGGLPKGDVRP
ncbi:MAG: glycine betaine/L-proline ABC transporter ATP-binding protein [Dehalococcoidia bacterium]|nr:glycine betaine/L-proline ABC transporter ATP-binding protein [Dehalococcoidia bacterium]